MLVRESLGCLTYITFSGQQTLLPAFHKKKKKKNLTVILCLLRVHWGFGVAVMGGRPAENLCLQISV